jgi:hypothetical protein
MTAGYLPDELSKDFILGFTYAHLTEKLSTEAQKKEPLRDILRKSCIYYSSIRTYHDLM